MEVSIIDATETVSLETLLEKNDNGKLCEKIEDDRYMVNFGEQSLEIIDTHEDYISRTYDDFSQLEQDLEVYDPDTSGRYGIFETEEGTKVMYDRRAGDNLIESSIAIKVENMV